MMKRSKWMVKGCWVSEVNEVSKLTGSQSEWLRHRSNHTEEGDETQ